MFNLDRSTVLAFAGGVLIGAASLMVMFATGKIAGISGMFSRVLQGRATDRAWRVSFLVGLVAGARLAFHTIESAAIFRPSASTDTFIVAGLLVGVGTRLGGGCTSGHGVCGVGRGSKSSIIATLIFVGAGMMTVFFLRHARFYFTS